MVEVKYIYSYQGKPVNEYTIRNGKYQVSVLNLGATLTKFVVRNRFKKYESVHLRFYDYRMYRHSSHPLTSLWVKEENEPVSLSNVYFKAEFIEDGLRFTSTHPSYSLTIDYRLIGHQLIIHNHSNDLKNYLFSFYLNLSGNLKRDCSEHQCKVDDIMIDLFNPVMNERFYAKDTLFLMDMENGVKLDFKTPIDCQINNRLSMPEKMRFNKGLHVTETDVIQLVFPLINECITIDFRL